MLYQPMINHNINLILYNHPLYYQASYYIIMLFVYTDRLFPKLLQIKSTN